MKDKVQIIYKQGEPDYAVLPWQAYEQLLQQAGYSLTKSAKLTAAPAEEQVRISHVSALKALREQAKLSVEQLAREVGISPHYMLLIEQGEREASQVVLRALARVLDVDQWNQ